jgi:flavin-dependent dehydrogenase
MQETRKEVVIIGGGPAGSFTALHLVSRFPELAEDIVLLEARRQGRDKLCAGGVAGRVMKAAKELEIDIASLPGKDVNGLKIRFADRETFTRKPNLARVIHRNILDSWLLDRVKERGVEVLTETPARRLSVNSRGASVETSNGTYTARVVVGADGMNGITRKACNLASVGRRKEYLYMTRIPDIEIPPDLVADYTPILFGIPGYAWFFPEEKGLNAGITGGFPGTMGFLKKIFFRMAEKNLGVRLDDRGLKLEVWPERNFSLAMAPRSERVIFVGDNLGVTPMTGEGIGICFDSAKAAAQEILLALGSNDYSFGGYRRRLLGSEFFPTWVLEHLFLQFKSPLLFHLLFLLATERNRPEGKTFMDGYCNVFSAEEPASVLTALRMLRSIVPSMKLVKALATGDWL